MSHNDNPIRIYYWAQLTASGKWHAYRFAVGDDTEPVVALDDTGRPREHSNVLDAEFDALLLAQAAEGFWMEEGRETELIADHPPDSPRDRAIDAHLEARKARAERAL